MLLHVNNIKKTYHNGKIIAVKSANFCIEQGSFNTIIGKSGCGKSTLLKIISGLIVPDEGNVVFNNCDITKLKPSEIIKYRQKNIGIIDQNYRLFDDYTAIENIYLPLLLQKKKINEELFHEICDILDITDILQAYPRELSGGEQQRIAIARAFLPQPQLILADEPTGNLDSYNKESVLQLIFTMKERFSETIIMVTHDMDNASKSDRILRMDGGIINDET